MNIIRLNTTAPDGFVKGGNGGNNYFYTAPLDLLRKIDDRETLTIKEAMSLYDASKRNYMLVFRYNLISDGGITLFFNLSDSQEESELMSPDNPLGVRWFDLIASRVYYDADAGNPELSISGALRFTYKDGYFEVSSI